MHQFHPQTQLGYTFLVPAFPMVSVLTSNLLLLCALFSIETIEVLKALLMICDNLLPTLCGTTKLYVIT
jgi:hypothetical protein